jgi:hypothetical protein
MDRSATATQLYTAQFKYGEHFASPAHLHDPTDSNIQIVTLYIEAGTTMNMRQKARGKALVAICLPIKSEMRHCKGRFWRAVHVRCSIEGFP